MSEFVNSTSLTGYYDFVASLGGDPDALLIDKGIDPACLKLAEFPIPYEKFVQLLEDSAEQLECPCFALKLAMYQYEASLGLLGLLMKASPSLRSALNHVHNYVRLFTQGVGVSVVEISPLTILQGKVLNPKLICRDGIDMVVGTMIATLRELLGSSWVPSTVYLEHSGKEYARDYSTLLKTKVLFDQEYSAITFNSDALDKVIKTASPLLERYLKALLEQSKSQMPENFVDQVRRLIVRQLGNREVTLEAVAEQFSITPRALQYKLAKHNISFFQLLDGVKSDIAAKYLESSQGCIASLCNKLGYSDQAAFNRAFRRWFGVPPSTWAKSNKL
jgi:AraC-like DNA-binding protein